MSSAIQFLKKNANESATHLHAHVLLVLPDKLHPGRLELGHELGVDLVPVPEKLNLFTNWPISLSRTILFVEHHVDGLHVHLHGDQRGLVLRVTPQAVSQRPTCVTLDVSLFYDLCCQLAVFPRINRDHTQCVTLYLVHTCVARRRRRGPRRAS